MLRLCLSVLLLSLGCAAQTVVSPACAAKGACRTQCASDTSVKDHPVTVCWSISDDVIRAVPDHGHPFTMRLAGDDPIGSLYSCMDRLHRRQWFRLWKHGSGVCYIKPESLHAGRHNVLQAKYRDVRVGLEAP